MTNTELELVKPSASVQRLVNAWTQVYSPNFNTLGFISDPALYTKLAEAISPEGRVKTAAKLSKTMIAVQCDIASTQTKAFYTYMQNVLNPHEARRLATASAKIYTGLIDLYQRSLLSTVSIPAIGRSLTKLRLETNLPAVDNVSDIERLSSLLKLVLLEFQDQHTQSKDWRALGLMTTQLNFCNQWITDKLTPIEQFLLNPYLNFVEEQIADSWYCVCAAAAWHSVDSPVLSLVETMIPLSEEIAQAAYQSLTHLLPNHRSRRGGLTNPGVAHSCIRDLKMFQAYLWRSMLEGCLVSVEQELLRLCRTVLPSIDMQWELMGLGVQILVEEVMRRIEPAQQASVLPYTTGMHQLFLNAPTPLDTAYPHSVLEVDRTMPEAKRTVLETERSEPEITVVARESMAINGSSLS